MSNDNKKKQQRFHLIYYRLLYPEKYRGLGYFNVWIGIGIIIATFAVGERRLTIVI